MINKGTIMVIVAVLVSVFMAIACFYVYYYLRWKHLWSTIDSMTPYAIKSEQRDILQVVMIGDSWAGLHHSTGMDSFLRLRLGNLIRKDVAVMSCGKGGEKTRGVYKLMFETGEYGTKQLLSQAPDYCVVFTGINDAAANLGPKQYCFYYRRIIEFLLQNRIRPVVIEIPDVNIWHLYGRKPIKDLVTDFVKSTMTHCRMYSFKAYREALDKMLEECYRDSGIVFVRMTDWNHNSPQIDNNLFLTDQIHLNQLGYEKLDSCIAQAIATDLSSKESVDANLANEPMRHNPQAGGQND